MVVRVNRGNGRSKKYKLCVILIALLLALVYSLAAVERYQSIECFDEQICLYKDTKTKIDDKSQKLSSEAKTEYADFDSLRKIVIDSRPVGLIYLLGLATYDKNANIGCFNKFVTHSLSIQSVIIIAIGI